MLKHADKDDLKRVMIQLGAAFTPMGLGVGAYGTHHLAKYMRTKSPIHGQKAKAMAALSIPVGAELLAYFHGKNMTKKYKLDKK